MKEIIDQLTDHIRAAAARKSSLCIRGGGSKDFYGGPLAGEAFDVGACRGIVDYEPSELIITARGGTPLTGIEAVLRERGQMLAFEPPHFGPAATLGGCIASGLSGPRRARAGAARDFVLGVRLLDGRGDDLRFGGRVMKNVAGFDVARLVAGSLGTLGVIVEASLKVLPLPAAEITLRFEKSAAEAIELMNEWAGRPLPVSATCHHEDMLTVRLSGAEAAVRAAQQQLGGEQIADGAEFWQGLREHALDFFRQPQPLWRLSLKSTTPPLALPGAQLIEWNGALRWLIGGDPQTVRAAAGTAGGHATLFRASDRSSGAFQPLPPVLLKIHRELKRAFDPAGIFNPGRLYPNL
ncbi:MAG TPA: glycolate oxidase subunit GlcE [Burkholderiales bacterium]|nr:glycolate oxidase subunit GlcE [Burkholderiales bacterium]